MNTRLRDVRRHRSGGGTTCFGGLSRLAAAALVLPILVLDAGATLPPGPTDPAPAPVAFVAPVFPNVDDHKPPSLERGLELFAAQCAVCHGGEGRADGIAAPFLSPRPRDFGTGSFRCVSTTNSMPHDEDLLRTLRLGMPGSAMPSWGHLPEQDLRDLVAAIRHLMLESRVRAFQAESDISREKAYALALDILAPGERLNPGPEPERTQEHLERGGQIFAMLCSRCHDVDGSARKRVDLVDSEGRPSLARDFTKGIFKGGLQGEDLVRRILLGMPGSAMPAMRLSRDDAWAVAHHIQSLIEPGAPERVQQSRQELVAIRVAGRLGDHLHLDDWEQAPESYLPLMPMQWRRDRPEGITFRALHDGSRLALRMVWDDPSHDDGPGTAREGSHDARRAPELERVADDGIAVQLSRAFEPPFFGMGAAWDPVTILEWRAAWQRDAEPGGWADRPILGPDVPSTRGDGTARADGSSLDGTRISSDDDAWPVEDLVGEGPGQRHGPTAPPAVFRGSGVRTPEGWDVILVVDLESLPDIGLGDVASLAFAVWDASIGDAGAAKSITVWHHLILDR